MVAGARLLEVRRASLHVVGSLVHGKLDDIHSLLRRVMIMMNSNARQVIVIADIIAC